MMAALEDCKSLVPDPERAPLIARAFEDLATGRFTKQEVIARMTEAGSRMRRGLVLSPQSFGHRVRNSIYVLAMATMEGHDLEGRALQRLLRRTRRRPIDIAFAAGGRPQCAEQASCSRQRSRRASHQTPNVSGCCSYWLVSNIGHWEGRRYMATGSERDQSGVSSGGAVAAALQRRNFTNEIVKKW